MYRLATCFRLASAQRLHRVCRVRHFYPSIIKMMNFTNEVIREVWRKAIPVMNQDPAHVQKTNAVLGLFLKPMVIDAVNMAGK